MKSEKKTERSDVIYQVGVDIEDEFTCFAECTSIVAANRAKNLLIDAGWGEEDPDLVRIIESNLKLDKIEINGKIIDLTEDYTPKGTVPLEPIVREPYVIMPCQNVYNDKISFWITRDGMTKAYYCFSVKSYEIAEYEYQVKNLGGYIDMFNAMVKDTSDMK